MHRFALLALVLAACGGSSGGGSSGGAPDAGGVTVSWSLAAETTPVTTTVDAGTPIQWHNVDGQTHTVTPDTGTFPADTGNISPGATTAAQAAPSTPGTYHYHCSIHPPMHGTIVVQ
jgi:plastocyanin